jgi:hypothetical protein
MRFIDWIRAILEALVEGVAFVFGKRRTTVRRRKGVPDEVKPPGDTPHEAPPGARDRPEEVRPRRMMGGRH